MDAQGLREEVRPSPRPSSAPQSAVSDFPASEQMIPHGVDSVSGDLSGGRRLQSEGLASASGDTEATVARSAVANNLALQLGYGQRLLSAGESFEIPLQRDVMPGSRAALSSGQGSAPASSGEGVAGQQLGSGRATSASGRGQAGARARSSIGAGSSAMDRSTLEASVEEEATTEEHAEVTEGSSTAEATPDARVSILTPSMGSLFFIKPVSFFNQ
jgi:hypothetical protein